MNRRQPPRYCPKCQQWWPVDEMSLYSEFCWRHCPVPAIRIPTSQHPRIPGFDPRDIKPKRKRGRPAARR